jgi:hypothetical protein
LCLFAVLNFKLEELFDAMQRPRTWQTLAQNLRRYENRLSSRIAGALSTTGSSEPPQLLEISQQKDLTHFAPGFSYAMQAVTCGDAIDAGNVTTHMVFDELIAASWVIDQICKRLRYSLRDVIIDVFSAVGPIWGDVRD